MATYKVIQDIEAEDKLVGPLTLRQFIYAAVAAICGYISFLGITKGALFILAVFLPIMLTAGFFAFPWKGDQPTEIWALARLRFAVKPRRRIWDQTGIKDYVTITVPKKVEITYTNGLNQAEVKSRLHTLADVIDSRGWATKNAEYTITQSAISQGSDRLVAPNLPQAVGDNITASDDMLDDQSAVSRNFSTMLDKEDVDRRKRVLQQMSDAQKSTQLPPQTAGPSLPKPVATPAQPVAPQATTAWFMNDPAANGQKAQIVTPGTPESDVPAAAAAEPTEEEKALAAQFKEQNQAAQQISYGHLHVVQPLSAGGRAATPPASSAIDYGTPPTRAKSPDDSMAATDKRKELVEQARKRAEAAVTQEHNDAIIEEFSTDDDKDIATLARLASKEIRKAPDEVEIRLH
jgi:hypothetical protein